MARGPSQGFFSFAERFPDRVALVDPTERSVTYGEIGRQAHRTAHGLTSLGLSPGDTVAVVLANGRAFLEVYAAAIEAGLSFVAVNWHLGAVEMGYILEDSAAKALIVDGLFADTAGEAADLAGVAAHARFSTQPVTGFRALAELTAEQPAQLPEDRRAGQVVFYTSGTTGRPKGVRKRLPDTPADEITLGTGIGLRRARAAPDLAPSPADTVHIVGGPLYHAAPIAAAAMALDGGGLLVLMDKWTPERFLELVARYRVTHANMVPTMFHRLLALPEATRRKADISSLEAVNHAGAPCPVDVKHRMLDWWGPIISESYSSTEGAGTSVTADEWLQRPGTVGRPSPGVTVAILDEDGGACPPNVAGLVYLTPTLWEFEYQNDPDKTSASRRAGMFTVGDIGYLDEAGYLFLCDRQSEIIISGGVNIYPTEVESILLTHPDIADAAVVGAPDDEWGEQVRAVVELRPHASASPQLAQEIVDYCRSRLAHFKCPRQVDFVENLGRDPNGKVRRRPLRDRYWEGRARKI